MTAFPPETFLTRAICERMEQIGLATALDYAAGAEDAGPAGLRHAKCEGADLRPSSVLTAITPPAGGWGNGGRRGVAGGSLGREDLG